MHRCSFPKITLVLICFFSVALALQAQNPPVFISGQQVTEISQARKVLAADINNDGFADLVALESRPGSSSSAVVIYLSNGDGTFRAPFSVVEGTSFADIALEDFNLDGNLDLAFASNTGPFDQTGTGILTVLFGDGQGGFGSPQTYQVGGTVAGIAAGDFDNDGRMDLAVLVILAF